MTIIQQNPEYADMDFPQRVRSNAQQVKFKQAPQGLKASIGIDYLIMNLTRAEDHFFSESPTIKIMYEDYGTRHFEKRAQIFCMNDKDEFEHVAVLLHAPKNPAVKDRQLCKLQLSNHTFYRKDSLNYYILLKNLVSYWELIPKGYERLDIFIDKNSRQDLDIFEAAYTGKLDKKGRPLVDPGMYHNDKKDWRLLTGVGLGKKTSRNKYMRIYDKTLEQIDKPKAHIMAYHKSFFGESRVFRTEFQLHDNWLKTLNVLGLESSNNNFWFALIEQRNIYKIFQMANKDYFVYLTPQGDLIDSLSDLTPFYCQTDHCQQSNDVERVGRIKKKNTLYSMKVHAKRVFRSYYEADNCENWAYCLNELLKANEHVKEYFVLKVEYWLKDFIKEYENPHFNFEFLNLDIAEWTK